VVNKSKRSIKKKVCKYCFKLKTFEEDKDYFSKISKILNDLIVFVISNNDFFRPNSTSCLPSPCSLMLVLLIVFLSCSTYKCDLSVFIVVVASGCFLREVAGDPFLLKHLKKHNGFATVRTTKRMLGIRDY